MVGRFYMIIRLSNLVPLYDVAVANLNDAC